MIGAAIAKTGYLAPYDASIAAVEQLVDETNAKGGIDGHKVRVVQADTHSDPQQAVVAAQKVIEEGADVLLFTCEALTAAAGAPWPKNTTCSISRRENAPGFGPPTTGRLSFSANPSLLSEASAGASFLHEQGHQAPVPLPRHLDHLRQGRLLGLPAEPGNTSAARSPVRPTSRRRRVGRQPGQRAAELRRRRRGHVLLSAGRRGGDQADPGRRDRRPDRRPGRLRRHLLAEGNPEYRRIYVTSNGSAYDPPNKETATLFKHLKRPVSILMSPAPCWRLTPVGS